MSHNLYVQIRPKTDGRRLFQKRLLQPAITLSTFSIGLSSIFPFFFSKKLRPFLKITVPAGTIMQ